MRCKFKNPDDLRNKIEDCKKFCNDNNKPFTLERLCWFIGISHRTMLNILNTKNMDDKYTRDLTLDEKKEIIEILEDTYSYTLSEIVDMSLIKNSQVGAIFNLKNNWNYVDKQVIENNNTNKNIDFKDLSEDERIALKNKALEALEDED